MDDPSHTATPSKTEDAYRTVRREILDARLAPDSALRPQALERTYGIGWTPAREALMRLEAEGLVTYSRNRGFAVAPVSRDELHDLQQARHAVELPLLADAMQRGDADWEADIVAAHHRLSRCPLPVDPSDEDNLSRWQDLHQAFHRCLLQAARSQWLLGFHEQLAAQLRRHQRILMIQPTLQARTRRSADARRAVAALRHAMSIDHHAVLMHAVLSRDTARATALLADHIGDTVEVFDRSTPQPADSAGH